jgi:hypothetical protein
MTEEIFARLVGQLLAGCQVPMSMGMLGAAREPLTELRDHLGLGFGWHTAEDAEKAVARWLTEPGAAMTERTTGARIPADKIAAARLRVKVGELLNDPAPDWVVRLAGHRRQSVAPRNNPPEVST